MTRLNHDATASSSSSTVVVKTISTDHFQNMDTPAPTTATNDDDERSSHYHLKFLLGVTTIQMIFLFLAIWGTTTFRRWPVILALGWIYVNVILMTLGSVYASVVFFGVNGDGLSLLVEGTITLQVQCIVLFWPMYRYIQAQERLKDLAAAAAAISTKASSQKNTLEIV